MCRITVVPGGTGKPCGVTLWCNLLYSYLLTCYYFIYYVIKTSLKHSCLQTEAVDELFVYIPCCHLCIIKTSWICECDKKAYGVFISVDGEDSVERLRRLKTSLSTTATSRPSSPTKRHRSLSGSGNLVLPRVRNSNSLLCHCIG